MMIRIKLCIALVNYLIRKKHMCFYSKLIKFIERFSKDKKYNLDFIEKVFNKIDSHIEISINNKQCLKRAFSAKLILLTYGINVSLKIGVKRSPFTAHAWIEKNNYPLFEKYEDISKYKVILCV